MKKVTAVLMVYAIIVIASSIFWVWSALSKSTLNAGNHSARINLAIDPDKTKQERNDVKADGQANDIRDDNDL